MGTSMSIFRFLYCIHLLNMELMLDELNRALQFKINWLKIVWETQMIDKKIADIKTKEDAQN